MQLPDSLRDELKNPLGELIPDSDVSLETLSDKIPLDSFVVTVGDKTSEKMIEFGIIPSVQIIDGQEKRVKRDVPQFDGLTEMSCVNPAAQITPDAIDTIKNSFKESDPVRITVIGEEDLLVIPVCMYAPKNSVVLYGQPNEGLVLVFVTDEIRNKTKSLLESMI